MSSDSGTYPSYVSAGGDICLPQPFVLEQCLLYGFWVQADKAKVQALLDHRFSQPSGGQVRYHALTDQVMLVFASTAKTYPQSATSWIPEIDVSFWIPTVALNPFRFNWFLPYVFVDNAYACISGREIYGFPKTMGTYEIPNQRQEPILFTADTIVFPSFTSGQEAQNQRILTVEATGTPTVSRRDSSWSGLADASAALLHHLNIGGQKYHFPFVLDELLNLLVHLFPFNMPMCFLRQLRDIADPTKACFQSITEAPNRLTAFHEGGLLLDSYQCTVTDFASQPMASSLGIAANTPVPVHFPFWSLFDFVVEDGSEVWNASNTKSASSASHTSHPAPPPTPSPSVPADPAKSLKGKKIAILGGGMGSMTTAFHLTEAPSYDPHSTEITLYQMGWRLGGKGASGRNREANDRVEEHGLHIWMGCYQNAFSLIQTCYKEMVAQGLRNPDQPLATWEEAFHKQNIVGVMEQIKGEWLPWAIDFPTNDDTPGGPYPTEFPTLFDYIQDLLNFLRTYIGHFDELLGVNETTLFSMMPAWMQATIGKVMQALGLDIDLEVVGLTLLDLAFHMIKAAEDAFDHIVGPGSIAAEVLRLFLKQMWSKVEENIYEHNDLRRLWLVIDLGVTVVIGLLADGILEKKSLDSLDKYDFREWLAKHGGSELMLQSAIVQGMYDMSFAYDKGDLQQPNFAAGVFLRFAFRMFLTYKGAIFYEMQAGMGDTIFGPLYLVLKQRGVKFKFFHRVKDLEVSADGTSIKAVHIAKQVDTVGEYDPMYPVKDLLSWPSAPLYEQIVPAQREALLRMKAEGLNVNLESKWCQWPDVEQVVLEADKDFDQVLLGISIGAFPDVCSQMIAANKRFAEMVEKVTTVQTLALQLWLDKDLEALGWKYGSPIMASFQEPLNTWGDFSHLIERESWPPGAVKNIAYFCGPFADARTILPPTPEFQDFPKNQLERVRLESLGLLSQSIGGMWPDATTPPQDPSAPLDWSWLVNPAGEGGQGPTNMYPQFFRANVDPTERYVLSDKGATPFRLQTDASGFTNVMMTGDWIQNGFNYGCIEGAVMSGMQASRAICGFPQRIVGEVDHPSDDQGERR